jgi:isopenicillin-N epimerase
MKNTGCPWCLDKDVIYLNHGSFGATLATVLDLQDRLRREAEKNPMEWFLRRLPKLTASTMKALGAFVGAPAEDLALISNATEGVNTVLRSLAFAPGDEIVVTDHEYGACRAAAEFAAQRSGSTLVVAKVPFPVGSGKAIVDAVLEKISPRTRLCMLDHVTSQTALVFPVAELVSKVQAKGVDVLVDGAHAPGMVPIDLGALRPAYYTGNLHKWMCLPKGAAFLYVRPDRQGQIQPLSISHGLSAPAADGAARFRALFEWTGTRDFTPWLCFSKSLDVLSALVPGGLEGLRACNHELAVKGRAVLLDALQLSAPCPEALLGSMASVPLPDSPAPPALWRGLDPLQRHLREEHRIEVPVMAWPKHPKRLLRISAQAYNTLDQYQRLAEAVRQGLRRGL